MTEPQRPAGDEDPQTPARSGIDWPAVKERGDFRLEKRLGTILHVGVRASTVCLAIGLVMSFVAPRTVVSDMLMIAGLMMLMLTPVARVATSVVDYGRRRDWTFFVLTLIVLAELCAGLVAALVFHRRL